MRNISTAGDSVTTIHAPCGVTALTVASPVPLVPSTTNVFVGLLPIMLNGDSNAPHTMYVGLACVPHVPFPTVTAQQITVWANGKPVVGAGDSYIGCGIIDVSPKTVFIP